MEFGLGPAIPTHGHPKDECDFIVCWGNDLEELGEGMPEILSVKEFIAQEKGKDIDGQKKGRYQPNQGFFYDIA